jgi:SpoVK/Ycf46/Vps4 family AAA+-type ATPase
MKKCWDRTIAVDGLKRRILTHMQVCFDLNSLISWYKKYYIDWYNGGQFRNPEYKRRILLIGPPGTGKSTVARGCIDYYARLTKSEIHLVELGLVRSKFEGEPSRNIQRAFRYIAELSENCKVVFLNEEFDSVSPSREVEQMHDTVRAMVNTINHEMDRLNTPNVFTIAISNFEGYIDYATKRRFDFVLYFQRPSFYQRMRLFQHLLSPYRFSLQDFNLLANKTRNYTQDDITRVFHLAIESAFYEDKPLSLKHLLYAISMIKPTGEYKNWRSK